MSSPAPASDAIPGKLFDFQVNGFGGVDFQDERISAADLGRALAALRRHRVARFFVTLITDDVDRLCRRLERLEQLRAADPAAAHMIAGYHLEGPWLSPLPGYCGAHPPDHMHAPSIAEFERLQTAAGGRIRLVTLAPECPGSDAFIRHLTGRGVHVSIGHTNASDADIDRAIAAGARFCTHLGNGAPLQLPRHDNVIQRLLARDELIACFIPDGVHLPPFVLRNFFRAKPAGRALFTTDAMAGAGAPGGRYRLGAMAIDIGADRIARPPGGEGFAGSTLAPDEGVRRVAEWLGLPLAEAVRLWSAAPAAAFGIALG
ncbi:MAG TPA: N-acetylglucosamine-6-phosphate deacetylase [Opitutus sp.]|nr:N-acetylglucosamine-6-phosphate deacetylase [Opitutus sp.]